MINPESVLRELLNDDEIHLVEFESYYDRVTKVLRELHDALQDMGGKDYCDVLQVVEGDRFVRAAEIVQGGLAEAVDMLRHHCGHCDHSECLYCAMEATQP